MSRSRRWFACLLAALSGLGLAGGPLVAQQAPPEPPVAEREATEGLPPGGQDETADDSDPDSQSDSDSDSDRPVTLKFVTDAPANVYVDGKLEGRVKPDEPLEVGVDLGEVELRATSAEVPQATWEKTLELEDAGVETVRIRMDRTIRKFRKEERKTGIYRDPRSLLMWPKRDNGRDVDLRTAYAYCRDLGTGGFDDWRLPTLDQLESLQAIWARSIYKIHGGIALSDCCVWSSDYDGSARAWTFNYRFRKPFQTNAGYEIGLRALCVREWDPEAEAAESEAEGRVADDD